MGLIPLIHKVVNSNTDCCVVSVRYMRVHLFDWLVERCFGGISYVRRHRTLGYHPIVDVCLSTVSCTSSCAVTDDRFESLIVFYTAQVPLCIPAIPTDLDHLGQILATRFLL